MANASSTIDSIETALSAIESRSLSFECASGAVSFAAVSFTMREALSEVYEVRVIAQTNTAQGELPERLLGQPAHLSFGGDRGGRTVHGIVHTIEGKGEAMTTPGDPSFVEITLAPKLALLANRKTSRIFQDMTVVDVIDRILDEWSIPRRWALSTMPASWPYNVQHQETDLEFIVRILAAEGIFFFFEDAPTDNQSELSDGMRVVFGDSSAAYAVIDTAKLELGSSALPAPTLIPAPRHQAMTDHRDRLFRFGQKQSLTTSTVLLRDYNGMASNADASANASATHGISADRFPLGKLRTTYEYLPGRPFDAHPRMAPIALEQLRRESRIYEGEVCAPRLRVGYLFSVARSSDIALDGSYLVTSLVTRGHDPRFFVDRAKVDDTIEQDLKAISASDVLRPARIHRSQHQGFDTAVVVGPPNTPVVSDSMGRVRVRFHWDEVRPGIDSDADDWSLRSTWLRVTQPWSGSGHGAFFLPRVGSEVLVGYIGGDINRPVIVGSLPNSAQPPPFSLPTDMGKSGIVTRGLSNEGQSELVFDDTGGRESARLSSQRKLELASQQDVEVIVGRNESIDVRQTSSLVVGQERRETIRGERIISVAGKSSFEALTDVGVAVAGDTQITLTSSSFHARSDTTISLDAPLECKSQSDVRLDVDGTTYLRHQDTLFVSVGAPDRPASHLLHVEGSSTHEVKGPLEISSDQEIVLRSGDSTISISPKAIQISTAKLRVDADSIELVGSEIKLEGSKLARIEAPKVFVLSNGATLALTTEARLNGAMVKLGAPPDPSDAPDAKKPAAPPTIIRVVDQDGKPVVGERCLVKLSDGTSRAFVTDKDGVGRIWDLTGSVQADLIDLSNWEKQ